MGNENVKTELCVILKAGNEIVAESKDPVLWQRVLSAVMSDSKALPDSKSHGTGTAGDEGDGQKRGEAGDAHLERFARFLIVDVKHLQGACDPSDEEPFIQLDHTSWASWRKRTPERGPMAVSAVGIAATLLALWFRELKTENITFAHIRAVLDKIGARYTNPTRSIKNCEWLQLKGDDQVRLHPSHIDKAIAAARSFVVGENNS